MSAQPIRSFAMSQSEHNGGSYTANQYTRRVDHIPNTAQEEEDNYILALHTDPEHHARVTALRTQYFSPKLNKLDAHLALLRALPGSQLPQIEKDIMGLAQQQQAFPISTTKPFMMAYGVGLGAQAPESRTIYAELRDKWEAFLSKQDKSFEPHYTVQNKAEKGVPEKTLASIQREWEGSSGMVDGLTLWRYEKGYWRHTRDFMFGSRIDEG